MNEEFWTGEMMKANIRMARESYRQKYLNETEK